MKTATCLRRALFVLFGLAVSHHAQAQAPKLSIAPGANRSFVLSWPGTVSGYVLESVDELAENSPWWPVVEPPTLANDELRLVLIATNSPRFFRLRFVSGNLPPDPATVAPPLNMSGVTDLASATAFLYTGSNPIQIGVTNGTIEFRRAAVLRGKVKQRDNLPLPGVSISILNHPELGQTLSRADGLFDLAVNGGGLLTVKYEKSGYCPVQRQVNAPWQDYAVLPDIVMVQIDLVVTAVVMGTNSPTQVARGSTQTDADGIRQATLLFPQGTAATMTLADGTTQQLTSLNVRATEYTVGPDGPKAMPAPLPPSSAYTYAVELSGDEAIAAGATEVRFSQPVINYVENFLNFPIGSIVPAGFYDRGRGVWVPSDNGRVIKIVGVSAGLADVDTVGSGLLPPLVLSEAERQKLGSLYTVGQSLWRVAVPHFSAWDFNWPFGPPPDARGPGVPKPRGGAGDSPDEDCIGAGSIIHILSQTLGEALPVTGTPFRLHYVSDRTRGCKDAYRLDIPLSGATVPASLRRIELEISVAGSWQLAQSFPAAPNQRTVFTWDGTDAYGRTVQGGALATVRIGYVYGGVYLLPSQKPGEGYDALFGHYSYFGTPVTGSWTRQEVTLWQESQSLLGTFDFRHLGLGGWDLSPHHVYDPRAQVLYRGDGTRRDAQSTDAQAVGVRDIITTAAGSKSIGFGGDGGPATQASLGNTLGVAVAPDGTLYIADTSNNRIRRVAPDGIITTVAGNGSSAYSGDGGPATQAGLPYTSGVAVGPDGSLYIASGNEHRVRRVGLDGLITTLAGNGTNAFSGDGGPATQAALFFPLSVTAAPDGSLYIADTGNRRVRRVSLDGTITTVAGNGTNGFSGDGGPATQAAFRYPTSVAVAPDGSLYIADSFGDRIRRVAPDGIITTVAGNGSALYSGDGGPATQATLYHPNGVAVSPDGSLYIADTGDSNPGNWNPGNRRIRRVGPDGIITTVAGNGSDGFSGDGGPATQAALSYPFGVAVAPDGSLYIADSWNHRIRRVTSGMPGLSSIQNISIASEDGDELYLFTSEGRHLRTLNALTGTVRYQFAYDSTGQLVSVTDGDGNLTTAERDAGGNPTAIGAPGGQRTTLSLDTNGYLASITNPAGEAHHMSYTVDGLLTTFTRPNGATSVISYDPLGHLVRDEDPAGGVKTLQRIENDNGHAVTLTTALGRTTTLEVERLPKGEVRRVNSDANGAHTEVVSNPDGTQKVTYPDGVTITLTLGPDPRFGMQAPLLLNRVRKLPGGETETMTARRIVFLADPNNLLSLQTLTDTITVNGRTFTRNYNAATRTMTASSPAGRQTISVLDAQQRVIHQEVSSNVEPITVTYDAQGRVIENRQGSQSWTFSYDARNRVVARADAAGRRISLAYDTNDRIIQKTLPSGAAYQFAYDANGNRTQVILPSGARHDLGYTPITQCCQSETINLYTPPANGSYLRAFNVDQQLSRITLPEGRVTEQSYDAAGRVNGMNYPEAVTAFNYFAGDPTERVANIKHTPTSGPAQNIAYSYNGSLISSMITTGAAQAQVSYSYDNNFLATNMNLVSGTDMLRTVLVWDRDGMISGFGPFMLTRNGPAGALSRISDGTLNTSTSYGYDSLARIATRSHEVNGQATYAMQLSYDNAGRVTNKTETVNGTTHTYAYSYDPDGQLTEVQRDGAVTERYAYDLNGNRTSRQLGGGPLEPASYDSQDRLLQQGTVAYQFNGDGFLKQRGSDTFQYSARGQLLQATVAGQPISYAYDGLGRRVSRTDVSGTSQFLYGDPASHIVTAVRSPDGELTALYYDTAGMLIALERGGARYYVATDQVGAPRVVSTSAGQLVKVLEYDSFGNVIADSNPAFVLSIGYAGGLADAATGLVHFGYRDYEPASGRWTTRDPVLFEGGQGNLYAYAGNKPINHRDPSGLFCISVSAYEGWGGGVQTCITEDGASVCGEVGFGIGVDVGVDNGGLEKSGTELEGELSYGIGPFEGGVKASLDNAGCLKVSPKGQIGPATFEPGKEGLDIEVHGAPKIGAGAEAKLAGKGCIQGKF